MTGLAALLLQAFWVFAPDGHLLVRQLSGSELAPAFENLRPALLSSWIIFHRRPSWAMAFYSPPEADLASVAWVAEEVLVEPERLLVGLELPRIFLYAPYFVGGVRPTGVRPTGVRPTGAEATGGDLAELETLALDVAENYFHALFEAYFDREARDPARRFSAPCAGVRRRSWRRCRSPSVSPRISGRRAISVRICCRSPTRSAGRSGGRGRGERVWSDATRSFSSRRSWAVIGRGGGAGLRASVPVGHGRIARRNQIELHRVPEPERRPPLP